MISKKRLFSMLVVSVALAIFIAPLCVRAEELWDPHLRGVDEGLAAGALPPTGLYFINNSYWATYQLYDNAGNRVADTRLDAYVDVPILLWVPGCEILGARYGVAIAQPFDYTSTPGILNLLGVGATDTGPGGNWGTYNTILVPGILTWKLPYDFSVAAKLSVYLPDASTTPNDLGHWTNNGLPSGNGFWTIEPGIGISWLHDGWNISADARISVPFKDTDTDYQSGNEFWVDYTITKTIGKWTVGLGAYSENQLNQDKHNGVNVGSEAENFGMGPIVGYNFGPVILQATYNWGIYTRSDVGGDFCNVRMIIPIPLCGM